MKKYFRFVITTLVIVGVLVTSVSAATNDGIFTATSNRQFYTPKSCDIQIRGTNVYFSVMKWDNYSFGAAYSWEGELRGVSENISAAYSGATAVTGNLPNIYKEYDDDDLSLGCWAMQNINSNSTYYAGITTIKGPAYDRGVDLLFESELGIWGGVDGLPVRYQVFATYLNTARRTSIAWL